MFSYSPQVCTRSWGISSILLSRQVPAHFFFPPSLQNVTQLVLTPFGIPPGPVFTLLPRGSIFRTFVRLKHSFFCAQVFLVKCFLFISPYPHSGGRFAHVINLVHDFMCSEGFYLLFISWPWLSLSAPQEVPEFALPEALWRHWTGVGAMNYLWTAVWDT